MRIAYGFENLELSRSRTALSIGNFDGVHRGHARIFEILREAASTADTATVAVTLDPHPLAVLNPERAPARLTLIDEKLAYIERCGVDACLVLRSEPGLLGLTAESFLARLIGSCRPRIIVEGPDFNFGKGRSGSIETLQDAAGRYGYDVRLLPTFHCDELPSSPRISSSSIRQALVDGRLDDANAMLGRAYRITGTIVTGDRRGRTIGFPTANIAAISHLLPQEAVYAAVAQLDDGTLWLAAVNVGPQPTFGASQARVEAHLLDFTGELVGRRIGLHFLERLRPQVRFAGVESLVSQLRRDVGAVRTHAGALSDLRPIPLPG